MFARVRLCLGAVLAAAALGVPAGAATVDLSFDRFDRAGLGSARGAMADFLGSRAVSNLRLETFDGYAAWDGRSGSTNPQHTRVGSFTAFGAAGSGRSVVGAYPLRRALPRVTMILSTASAGACAAAAEISAHSASNWSNGMPSRASPCDRRAR